MKPAKNKTTQTVTLSTWAGFAMMCVGMFMAILDVQVVATSLPTIQRALKIPQDQMSWVQTAYLVAEIIAIPLTGFLTRMLTMRWLFVIAVSLFTLASIACAASGSFTALIISRIVQGFFGGMLIPTVFSAIFLLFPFRNQALATMIGGVLAVLAPTVGPAVGGWITETYSWPWLFLINVLPGVMAATVASLSLPKESLALEEARHLDWLSLSLLALSLAALEIAIKEAPERGWASPWITALLVVSFVSGAGFVTKSLRITQPLIDLRVFKNQNFTAGCVLSFIVGMGLFGSVYLMPMFLAYVRGHGALDIGKIMLVTGIAQLATAPLAVALDQRYDERALTALGFLIFGIGLGLSCVQTTTADYDEMFWPQVIRGCATMLCILPSTRLALGLIAKADVPDASGLFNMMRNLGGAIGIAIIDTLIHNRASIHSRDMIDRLTAGDIDLAKTLGVPLDVLAGLAFEPQKKDLVIAEFINKAALVEAINDSWAFLAISMLAAILVVPFARITSQSILIPEIRKGRVIVRRGRIDVRR